jgi:nitroreductase
MEFYEVIQTRRSVRAYKPDAVPQDKIDRILEAVRLAPTAANRQPFAFIVIRDEATRTALKAAYGQPWFYEAPVIICACAQPAAAWRRSDGRNYADVDTTIAMDHLILAATAEGLGTCWIGAFNPQALKEILKLPAGLDPIAMTPLGYPADAPRAKSRKDIQDFVRYVG